MVVVRFWYVASVTMVLRMSHGHTRYRDDILDLIVRPHAGAVDYDFVLMNGHARSHRVRMDIEYLQAEAFRQIDWPALSLDLNPVENAWSTFRDEFPLVQHNRHTSLLTHILRSWKEFLRLISGTSLEISVVVVGLRVAIRAFLVIIYFFKFPPCPENVHSRRCLRCAPFLKV